MPDCVEHYIEGRSAWKVGLIGFFTRLRGIIATIVITVCTMSTPFWWPEKFPTTINIELKYGFFILVLSGGYLVVLGFYYLRYRTRRSLDIKHYLHQFAHYLRDFQTEIYQIPFFNRKGTEGKFPNIFCVHAEKICEMVREYFRRLTKDSTVEVAVRVATIKRETGEVVYRTIARSSGLSSKRAETTEDIAISEGIPRFFIEEKDSQGVLIYYDLRKAAEMGAYKLTENDKKYPHEIVTMIVAPLNAWAGDSQSMIAILYVTSREKKAFSIMHVDSMRFIADSVAKSFATYYYQLKTLK